MVIPGFENYKVFENGEVFSFARKQSGVKLNPGISTSGYLQVGLYVSGVSTSVSVHRLVASVYLGLDLNDSKSLVDHIDGNKLNNHVSNLRIVTPSENIRARNGELDYSNDMSKWCCKCEKLKPRSDFGRSSFSHDGLRTYCKMCTNVKGKS